MTKYFIGYSFLILFPFIFFFNSYLPFEQKQEVVEPTKVLKMKFACDPDRDRQALIDLYEATGGDNWTRKDNWLSDRPLGEWDGIITNAEGCVISIDLTNNELSGILPNELGDLTELESFFVNDNNLTGACLHDEYSNWTKLKYFSASDNQIEDSIPSSWGSLVLLEDLLLYNNQVSGQLHEELGNMVSLINLSLDNNKISDTIPSSIGKLLNLVELDLSANDLTGSIPPSLGDLSNLKTLELYNNKLSGAIPKELAKLNNLEVLYLHENNLSGCYPNELLTFCDLGFSTDFVRGYNLSENPDLLYGGDFELFCTEGNHPDYDALMALYNSTNGAGWTNNDGWRQGASGESCNPCNWNGGTWYGITCNNDRIITIDLDGQTERLFGLANGNNLSGIIPDKLVDLIYLINLSLRGNNISGEIPDSIGNLLNLEHLYLDLISPGLTGEIPESITRLSKLKKLYLGGNDLKGKIPFEIGNIINLRELSLNGNQLSDTIPESLWNLKQLYYLWLNDNQLSGNISSSIKNINRAIDVRLNNNFFSGSIPEEIGLLDSIGLLHLNDNNLSGCIPDILTSLCLPTPHPDIITGDRDIDFSNNLLLPWQGDFSQFCQTNGTQQAQVGESCDDENPDTEKDMIQADCSCKGEVINDCVARDRAALVAFYHATNGDGWSNSENWLSDKPLGDWLGVNTNEDGCVIELTLESKGLQGNFPDTILALSELQYLNLGNNKLVGNLPEGVDRWTKLKEFDIFNNPELTGVIPTTLGNITTLTNLDLTKNNHTGEVPTSLGQLVNLKKLDLSDNDLTGELPERLSDLTQLTIIDLANNFLEGCFPRSYEIFCKNTINANFENNPSLAWMGNFSEFCNTNRTQEAQINAPCDDRDSNTNEDRINENCECIGKSCSNSLINIQESICFGETYLFNGKTLNLAGEYIDTIQTTLGCDSIITLDLAVIASTFQNEAQTICEGDVYNFNGMMLAESGTYQDTLKNIRGCDSIITLDLAVIASTFQNENKIICEGDSYNFNGRILSKSGMYQDTLENIQGCDSIIIELNLTILNKIQIFDTSFTCNENEVRVDTVFSQSAQGCDSTIITEFLLNPSDSTFLTELTCDSNQVRTNIRTLTNQFDCDSTIITEIKFDETLRQSKLDVFTCDPSKAGFDTTIVQTALGCDSTIITAIIFDGIIRQSQTERTTCNPNEAGIDTMILKTVLDCDSLIITITKLLASDSMTLILETCNITDVDTIVYNHSNAAGCDSIVTIETKLKTEETILLEADEVIIDNSAEEKLLNILENDLLPVDADQWFFSIIEAPASGNIYQQTDQVFLEDFEAINSNIDSFTYEICLTECADICDTAKVRIIIENDCINKIKENIPNAFSPKSEHSLNTIFDPLLELREAGCLSVLTEEEKGAIEFIVFNRWGEIVFQANGYDTSWDGKSNNDRIMPRATYYYRIKIPQGELLKDKVIMGPINLLY